VTAPSAACLLKIDVLLVLFLCLYVRRSRRAGARATRPCRPSSLVDPASLVDPLAWFGVATLALFAVRTSALLRHYKQ
jgi:hypothetical protein